MSSGFIPSSLDENNEEIIYSQNQDKNPQEIKSKELKETMDRIYVDKIKDKPNWVKIIYSIVLDLLGWYLGLSALASLTVGIVYMSDAGTVFQESAAFDLILISIGFFIAMIIFNIWRKISADK